MSYICEEVPEADRRAVQRAVFIDLKEDELDAYIAAVKVKEEQERIEVVEKELAKKNIGNIGATRNISQQEDAINNIDCDTIDLREHDRPCGRYDYDRVEGVFNSCLKPNQKRTEEEAKCGPGDEMRYDCDQVRAMIARLVKYGEWTIDDFRKALGRIERKNLIDFLNRRGPQEGANLGLYSIAWQFFRIRDLLGVPLPQKPDSEGSTKRKRDALSEQPVNAGSKARRTNDQTKAQLAKADEEGRVFVIE